MSVKRTCSENMAQIDPPSVSNLSAVILAGGQGTRVDYHQKALLSYQGQTLLESILQRLTRQCSSVWVNVNADHEQYKIYHEALYSDGYKGFLGPLAGMHAAWHWLDSDWIVFVPCDNPNLPEDLAMRLIKAYQQKPAPLVAVFDGKRIQPLYLLMHRCMEKSLEKAIEKSHLSVYRWIEENSHSLADFSDSSAEAFHNLNTLERFKEA